MSAVPTPPAGLGTSGKRLWRAVLGPYALDEHELLLLRQACRVVDTLDRLAEEGARHPITVTNIKGDEVPHPTLGESRQQAIVLARLLTTLRLPSGKEGVRPQRRGGARGAYGVRGVV